MGDTTPTDPSLQLPSDAPKELRDFLSCNAPTLTLQDGPMTWISLDGLIPADLKSYIPDKAKPSLTIEPGTAPGTATIKLGIAGFTLASLPATIANGQLTLDTSELPPITPQAMKDGLKQSVDNLNAWFQKNGKALAAPAFGKGQVSLSKVPAAAPAQAPQPPAATTTPTTPGPSQATPKPAPAPTPVPVPAPVPEEKYLDVPVDPPGLPPEKVVAPTPASPTGSASKTDPPGLYTGPVPQLEEAPLKSLYPEGMEPPGARVETRPTLPMHLPTQIGSEMRIPTNLESMTKGELQSYLNDINFHRYGDDDGDTDAVEGFAGLATKPDPKLDALEGRIKHLIAQREAEEEKHVAPTLPPGIKPAPQELKTVANNWRLYTLVGALIIAVLGAAAAAALGAFNGSPVAVVSSPTPAALETETPTIVESAGPSEEPASEEPSAAGLDLSKIQWRILVGATAGSTGGAVCTINISARVNVLALGSSAEEDQALYDAVIGKPVTVLVSGPGLPPRVDFALDHPGDNEGAIGKIGNAMSGEKYSLTLTQAAGIKLNLHSQVFTNPCPP